MTNQENGPTIIIFICISIYGVRAEIFIVKYVFCHFYFLSFIYKILHLGKKYNQSYALNNFIF
jgi:hypothetical protein